MGALVLAKTNELTREEWLEQRKKGIGGSDIAGIMGLSPFSSPIKVYQDKLGELPPQEDNEKMYWGRVLEDLVAKEFQNRTGLKVRRKNAMLQHPKYKYMLANVDRVIVGAKEGLECKTTSEFMKNEWVEGEEIPAHYLLQCQWYMAVTGFKKWHIAVLIGGNKFHYDVIERDEELIQMMIEQARGFWENHVLKEDPPAFDGSQSSEEVLKQLYPQSEPTKTIYLLNSYEEKLERYDELKEQKKEIEYEIKEIENQIKGEMEDAEVAQTDSRKITWKTVASKRFNSKAFKKDHPELYQEYVNESSYRRFQIK